MKRFFSVKVINSRDANYASFYLRTCRNHIIQLFFNDCNTDNTIDLMAYEVVFDQMLMTGFFIVKNMRITLVG